MNTKLQTIHLTQSSKSEKFSQNLTTDIEARIKLQSKLLVAEKQIAEGSQLLEHDEVIARIRGKISTAK